jgi:hypothetical protein
MAPTHEWVVCQKQTHLLVLKAAYNKNSEFQRVLFNEMKMEISITCDDLQLSNW